MIGVKNMSEELSEFQMLMRKEQEQKARKKEYDRKFVSLKVKREITEQLDRVIEFNQTRTHITLKRGEMIAKLLDYYIDTVIRNAGSEDKARERIVRYDEARKFYEFVKDMAEDYPENSDDSEF